MERYKIVTEYFPELAKECDALMVEGWRPNGPPVRMQDRVWGQCMINTLGPICQHAGPHSYADEPGDVVTCSLRAGHVGPNHFDTGTGLVWSAGPWQADPTNPYHVQVICQCGHVDREHPEGLRCHTGGCGCPMFRAVES